MLSLCHPLYIFTTFPTTGEHWYLVLDDALKSGSVLSCHVDGAMLSQSNSSLEFVDPCEYLPEIGHCILLFTGFASAAELSESIH